MEFKELTREQITILKKKIVRKEFDNPTNEDIERADILVSDAECILTYYGYDITEKDFE